MTGHSRGQKRCTLRCYQTLPGKAPVISSMIFTARDPPLARSGISQLARAGHMLLWWHGKLAQFYWYPIPDNISMCIYIYRYILIISWIYPHQNFLLVKASWWWWFIHVHPHMRSRFYGAGNIETSGPGNADFQRWWGSENGSAASMQVARNTGVGRGIVFVSFKVSL